MKHESHLRHFRSEHLCANSNPNLGQQCKGGVLSRANPNWILSSKGLVMSIIILFINYAAINQMSKYADLLVLYPKIFPPFFSTFLITKPLEIKVQLGFHLLKTPPCTANPN